MKWFRSKAVTSGLAGALVSGMVALTGCVPEARAKQGLVAQDAGHSERFPRGAPRLRRCPTPSGSTTPHGSPAYRRLRSHLTNSLSHSR